METVLIIIVVAALTFILLLFCKKIAYIIYEKFVFSNKVERIEESKKATHPIEYFSDDMNVILVDIDQFQNFKLLSNYIANKIREGYVFDKVTESINRYFGFLIFIKK